MKRDRYVVTVVRVPGVTRQRMISYIEDAVQSWGGQFQPPVDGGEELGGTGDPLGPPCALMEDGAVRVRAVSNRRQKKKRSR